MMVLCAVLFSISFPSQAVFAQSRQDALRALQTLQSRCESGINYDGYVSAIREAQSHLREFLHSKESERNPEFSERVERALIAYQTAFVIWNFKYANRQEFVSIDHPTIQAMLNVYPDSEALFDRNGEVQVPKLVTFFWDKGDERIAEAKRLISGGKSRR
ncbi:MAG: hypothetical protein WAW37_18210 [Syntrophobacteraceae bacterium]